MQKDIIKFENLIETNLNSCPKLKGNYVSENALKIPSIDELMFKMEHFKMRMTPKNLLDKEYLLGDESKYEVCQMTVRSKLWWLFKEWDTLTLKEIYQLMDGFIYWNKDIFDYEEFYKILFLEVVIDARISVLKKKSTDELEIIADTNKLNKLAFQASLYAIGNTRNAWMGHHTKNEIPEEEFEHYLMIEFGDKYFDRKVLVVEPFNKFERIVKVYFENTNDQEEEDWILAFDMGDDWYLSLSRLNSYIPLDN